MAAPLFSIGLFSHLNTSKNCLSSSHTLSIEDFCMTDTIFFPKIGLQMSWQSLLFFPQHPMPFSSAFSSAPLLILILIHKHGKRKKLQKDREKMSFLWGKMLENPYFRERKMEENISFRVQMKDRWKVFTFNLRRETENVYLRVKWTDGISYI